MRHWPLTGRAQELATVRGALTQPGRGGGVVILGAAGVGKSRLAREASSTLGAGSPTVEWVQATQTTQMVPLGAFAGLVTSLGEDPLLVCSTAARTLAGHGTTGLVVDDAHRLDALSAALVLHLATHEVVRLVVTARVGEPAPEAVTALWKEGLLERVDLAALTDDEAAELVSAVLVEPVEPEALASLAALGAGNPLYLREVVLGELRSGRLHRAAGRWTWNGRFHASTALVDLVEASALAVPESVRDVLDLVAVGGDVELDVALQCLGHESVEAAEHAGLVVVRPVGDGRSVVRPFHPLYAEVRRAQVGEAAARRWRGRVASILRQRTGQHELSLSQAALLLDSDLQPEPAALVKAAQQSIRLFDYGLGARFAQAAVDAGGGFEAGMLLAFAQGWSNRLDDALATCARMLDASANDHERVRATIAAAGHTFFMCGRADDGLVELQAGRLSVTDPRLASLLDALESFFAACLGRPGDAVRLAGPVLEHPGLAPQLEVCALFGMVTGLGLGGRVGPTARLAERAWTVGATAFDATHLRLGLVYLHVCALLAAGLVRQAHELAQRRSDEIAAGLVASAMAGGFCGAAALAAGDVAGATRRLERCCEAIRSDTSGWRFHATSYLARAYALAGRTAEAGATCALADDLAHPGHLWFEPERLLTQAWVAADLGAVSEAVQIARRAARWSKEHGQKVHEVLSLQTALRWGDASGSARLSALVGQVDGPRAPAALLHAHGLTAASPDRLREAAVAYLELGDRTSAADAYAQAAVLLAARGRTAAQAEAVRQAGELALECRAMTPALRLALHPLAIAPREREVATLAARGLSNRVIAGRLQLSVRTVEGHLYRAYARLGVGSRAAAAGALAVAALPKLDDTSDGGSSLRRGAPIVRAST